MFRMNNLKFVTLFKRSAGKVLRSSSSQTAASITDKKLDHYRNLNATKSNDVKPAGWDEAKPFDSIPGPTPLPLLGNSWRFFVPKFGEFHGLDLIDVYKRLQKQYGDIVLLKGLHGIPPMVVLYDPKDFENLYRNEGIWPVRKGLDSLRHYRESRKHILPSAGLVNLQEEDWFKFRTLVNPILMQPRNILQYTEKMNSVADELIDNINYFAKQNEDGQMPDNFNYELYKWALESVGLVTTNKHLGCLKRTDANPNTENLINSVVEMFHLMHKLDLLPSLWRFYGTRNWRKYVKIMDFIINTNVQYINEEIEKFRSSTDEGKADTSVLYQMTKSDVNVAKAMAVDMLVAGIDTTGRSLAATLYFLGKNPDKQEVLREEAYSLLKNKDSPVTKEILAKANYTRAVIKESARFAPIAIANQRAIPKDLVFGGYQIPKGTDILAMSIVLYHQDKYFPQADRFIPERWLPTTVGELSYKNNNPFIFLPFGYGPRSCIGKRLANLEMETALLKLSRNFELKWPHEDMVFATKTIHGIDGPLKIQMKPLDH